LPGIGVEDVDYTGVAVRRWVLSVQGKIRCLLDTTKAGECAEDSHVTARLENIK